MRRLALPALLTVTLAACAAAPEPPPAAPSFRDRAVPIGATTRGGPGDLAGEWVVSQSYGAGPEGRPLAAGSRVRIAAPSGGAEAAWAFLPAGGAAWAPLPMRAVGPGRYAAGASDASDLLVLWVDDDFRTAAVGAPDGRVGWIMDRPGRASPDRTAAAREVLDWSGYDLGRLRP